MRSRFCSCFLLQCKNQGSHVQTCVFYLLIVLVLSCPVASIHALGPSTTRPTCSWSGGISKIQKNLEWTSRLCGWRKNPCHLHSRGMTVRPSRTGTGPGDACHRPHKRGRAREYRRIGRLANLGIKARSRAIRVITGRRRVPVFFRWLDRKIEAISRDTRLRLASLHPGG